MRISYSGMGKPSFSHTPKSQKIANEFESECMNKLKDVTRESLVKALNDIVKETKGSIINHPKNRAKAFKTIKKNKKLMTKKECHYLSGYRG